MWLMMQYPEPEDWVLATVQTCSVRDFCSKVFANLGIELNWQGLGLNEVGMDSEGRILVRVDERYFRPNEVEFLQGDATKAKKVLGWEPKHDIDSLITDMISA